jgi:hypothetical protein
MPYYYDYKDNIDFGNISIVPRQWYRRFIKIGKYSPWPYITMGKIEFTLSVEKLPKHKNTNKIMDKNIYILG